MPVFEQQYYETWIPEDAVISSTGEPTVSLISAMFVSNRLPESFRVSIYLQASQIFKQFHQLFPLLEGA